jgi:hypothetical protein
MSILIEHIGVRLCRTVWVWIVQKFLNAEKNLLDGNGGLPAIFSVENRKANSP